MFVILSQCVPVLMAAPPSTTMWLSRLSEVFLFYSSRIVCVMSFYYIAPLDSTTTETQKLSCCSMCSSFCGASVASSRLIQPLRSPVYCSHETCRFPGKLVRLRQPGRPISPRSHSGRPRLLLHGRVPSLHVADAELDEAMAPVGLGVMSGHQGRAISYTRRARPTPRPRATR